MITDMEARYTLYRSVDPYTSNPMLSVAPVLPISMDTATQIGRRT